MSYNKLFYEKLRLIYNNQDEKKPSIREDYDDALNEINNAKLNLGKTKFKTNIIYVLNII